MGDEKQRYSLIRMKISLVIPLQNEEENLPELINRLVPTLRSSVKTEDYELLLVNDNSTDGTATLIDRYAAEDPRIRAVHRRIAPGFGNAIKEGFRNATGDIIIPFMGDLSDDPEDIVKLVQKIEEGYDLAYGSRFIKDGSASDYPLLKLIANRAFNNLVRLLYGMQERDVTNAFKAYRREVLEGIGELEAEGFDLTVEIPLKAHIHGFKAGEVPVHWHGRTRGEAKLKLSQNGSLYGKRLLKLFIWGNTIALKDLFQQTIKGSPIHIIIALFIGLLILAGILFLSGLSGVYLSIKNANLYFFLASCLAVFMAFPLRTWRWSILLRTSGHTLPRNIIFNALLFGWFMNYLLPARVGDITRGVALKTTANVPLGVALMTIIIERILDMVMLGLLLTPALLFLAPKRFLSIGGGVSVIIFLLIFSLFFVYRFDYLITEKLKNRFAGIHDSIRELKEGLCAITKNPAAMGLSLILSLPIWIFEIASIYFAAKAVHINIPFFSAIAAGVTTFILQALPLTPAGIGIHEGSIAGVLVLFEIPLEAGTSLALLDHLARAVIVYLFGAIATVHIGFQSRRYFNRFNRQRSEDDGAP